MINMNSRKNYVKSAIAALSGASMLALSLGPASALTLPSPMVKPTVETANVELASFRHGGGGSYGHGYGYGWGHGYYGHGYYGHGYWGYGYGFPYYSPCSIYGGPYYCYY
jgi:uncharacterized membrane protein